MRFNMRKLLRTNLNKLTKRVATPLLLLIAATFCLTACAPQSKVVQPLTKMQKRNLAYVLLTDQGAKVIHRGNQVDVLIPTALLFNPHSTNLYPQASYLLSPLYHAIKTYDVESVQIKGLNFPKPTNDMQLLTRARAGMIGNHIWLDGLNKKVSIVVGGLLHQPTPVSALVHGFHAPVIWVHWTYYKTARMYN